MNKITDDTSKVEKTDLMNLANVLTAVRIALCLALLPCTTFSTEFYLLYISAGITDMLDGPIARKTNTVSDLGTKLDSAADFLMVIVCLVKLLPVLCLSSWIYFWIAIIAIIKICNLVYGSLAYHKLVSVHSFMNKLTGILLFAFPLTLDLNVIGREYSAGAICTVATIAAIQERLCIRKTIGKNE